MKLTKEQERAIVESRNKNILLQAAAGSGKTRTIVYKVLDLVKSGFDLKKLVLITFTRKAALEMKTRIEKATNETVGFIGTIHSFASNLIKKFDLKSDVFLIDDDVNKKILEVEFKNFIANRNFDLPNFNAFEIFSLIKQVLEKEFVFRDVNLETLLFDFKANWQKILKKYAKKVLLTKKEVMEFISEKNGKYTIKKGKREEIDEILKKYEVYDLFPKKVSASTLVKYYNLFEQIDKQLEELLIVDGLSEFINAVFEFFEYYNKKYSTVDFSSLINRSIELLNNSQILAYVKEAYQYFIVDEFQDTDSRLLQILLKVAGNGENFDRAKVFLVGDPNQAIYGFRGTKLDTWNEVANKVDKVLYLTKTFRCSREISNFVNNIFGKKIENWQKLDSVLDEKGEIKIIDFVGRVDEKLKKDELYEIKIKNLRNFLLNLRKKGEKVAVLVRNNKERFKVAEILKEIGEDVEIKFSSIGNKRIILENLKNVLFDCNVKEDIDKLLEFFELGNAEYNYRFLKYELDEILKSFNRSFLLGLDTILPEFKPNLKFDLYSENFIISTIHSFKGLEAETVVILNLKKIEKKVNNNPYIFNPNLGLVWLEKGDDKKLIRSWVRRVEKDLEKTEENRLSYVALTRAKKNLYIDWDFMRKLDSLVKSSSYFYLYDETEENLDNKEESELEDERLKENFEELVRTYIEKLNPDSLFSEDILYGIYNHEVEENKILSNKKLKRYVENYLGENYLVFREYPIAGIRIDTLILSKELDKGIIVEIKTSRKSFEKAKSQLLQYKEKLADKVKELKLVYYFVKEEELDYEE